VNRTRFPFLEATPMSLRHLALVLAVAFSLSACSGGEDPGAAPAAHAAPGAVPGSHADWCDEHGVPESRCTRCDAALVPAFKATGDWCAEHGLPESQCHACNPGLVISRPAPEGG
jgi:hypothetical protein